MYNVSRSINDKKQNKAKTYFKLVSERKETLILQNGKFTYLFK